MKNHRILHVIHRFPYPPDKGDRIRAFHTLKHLASNAEVWVAALADESVAPEQLETLRSIARRVEVIPHRSFLRKLLGAGRSLVGNRSLSEELFASRRLRQTIVRWCRESTFDSAVFSASSLGPYARLPQLDGVRKLIDYVDVDSLKWKQYSETSRGPKSALYRREHKRVGRLEQELLGQVDAVTFVSEDEADRFRIECKESEVTAEQLARVHAVTNGVDLEYFYPYSTHDERSVCFLGAMDYKPNVDAVVWFAREVWPHLRKKYSDLEFNIVGRNPVKRVKELESLDAGIRVTGRVDDVRPWVARAVTVIAPLQIARGVQNKVLEAMAMGRVVVASREALTGLQTVAEKNVLVATTPDDWFYQIRRLIEQPLLRRDLILEARAYVEALHSWKATLRPLDRLLGLEPTREGTPALR